MFLFYPIEEQLSDTHRPTQCIAQSNSMQLIYYVCTFVHDQKGVNLTWFPSYCAFICLDVSFPDIVWLVLDLTRLDGGVLCKGRFW